ncbi:protein phosphatase 1 regulatory subunit 12C-like isoform X3 [Neocloeon triangulifer]|uniref:protein phosphatase 1 regulatory subunit 12C-like isoform X3 n=1 Tax=Neocloeon triangulifer TaxID=2078957 RepID=UPI00286EFD7C|nr:protein phosphatase 1 regulatory subunit 12C-like isoform X3 [Neocloeon triangulifer]
MSLETRNNSALFKRAEQLKQWEESKTNAESTMPKRGERRKVRFSAGCVFLAACAAGDLDEVDRLLGAGADIDTANVDGLTALHQACIDDNLEMVEFLVKRGADVNRGDNEGWTPLHASASCGFKSIARLLIEKGADVAAVNNDGELPVDIAESDEMELLLLSFVNAKGIDCDAARNKEENLMLADAKEWLKAGEICDQPHPKTGATALHVASAKGYIQVMKMLLQAGADVNGQDSDGWTPLHAASHWAQKDACQLLIDNLCDMEVKNFVGQTAEDIADPEVLSSLQEMKKNQAALLKNRPVLPAKRSGSRTTTPGKRRSMDVIILTEVAAPADDNRNSPNENLDNRGVEESQTNELSEESVSTTGTSEESELEDLPMSCDEDVRNRVNGADVTQLSAPKSPPKPPTDLEIGGIPSWRRSGSARSRNGERSQRATDQSGAQEVVLRRTASLDEAKEAKDPVSPTLLPGLGQVRSLLGSSSVPVTPTQSGSKLSPGNIFKNLFKSFVPPVRDEESETQRKAHAKRVRETRRSTQGVTLEEIKTAEQLVRKKHQQSSSPAETSASTTVTAAPSQQAPQQQPQPPPPPAIGKSAAVAESAKSERRPSWRLQLDPSGSKFLLEDASGEPKRSGPAAAPPDASVTVALRKGVAKPALPAHDDKEQDKENDSRNAQATQAVIQRRRRPKRRSTGVVHVDMDDIDPERQESGSEGNRAEDYERPSQSMRLAAQEDEVSPLENGEVDYKKLYEEMRLENDKLQSRLKKFEEEFKDTSSVRLGSLSSLSETEKRERRSMERKLAEMEEELKQFQKLKAENEKLRAENRALTRVVSKLSTTPNKPT